MKIKTTRSACLAIGTLALAATTTSNSAATLVKYEFPLVSGAVSSPTTQTATTVATNVTASTFGGGGVTPVLYSVGAASTGSDSDLGQAYLDRTKTPTTANVDAAGTTGYYFSFTVTPDAGKKLNLTTLNFYYGDAQADASTLNLGLWSSADSFATQVGSTLSWSPATTTVGNFETTSSGTQYATLDLSAPAFQNLTAATTFRIYGWDSTNVSGQLRIDDVQLNGTVVPEPRAALLGGLGMLCLLRRRRA